VLFVDIKIHVDGKLLCTRICATLGCHCHSAYFKRQNERFREQSNGYGRLFALFAQCWNRSYGNVHGDRHIYQRIQKSRFFSFAY